MKIQIKEVLMRYRYDINRGIQKLKSKTTLAISGLGLGVAGLVMALGISFGASAAPRTTPSMVGPNWRVLNITYLPNGNTNFLTDHAYTTNAGIAFQIPEGVAGESGTHTVYLITNWNQSLPSNGSITVSATWDHAIYVTRSTTDPGAFARVEFQDVTSGNYNMNDYWWYNGGALDLNTTTSGSISASLSVRSNWSNICGKSATDTTVYTGADCVGGTYPNVSPSDGFTNAMQNVKQVSLSFGRTSAYASGVAAVGGPATFTLDSYDIN